MAPSALAQTPAPASPARTLPGVDALGIEVAAGAASRPFVVTDGQAAFYYGEAAAPHRTAWQGLNVRGMTFVDDWAWTAGRDTWTAGDVAAATVFPDRAERRYGGGRVETVTLLDGAAFVGGGAHAVPGGAAVLLVSLEGRGPAATAFTPLVADRRDAAAFDVRTDRSRDGDVLLIARRDHMTRRSATDAPVWLAAFAPRATARVTETTGQGAGLVEVGGIDGTLFAPGRLDLPSRGILSRGNATTVVALAVADTPEAAAAAARSAAREHDTLTRARRTRMQALLDASFVATPDDRLNTALAWARLSMDALVMRQRGVGVFAGLPWFNDYWGRDTFLSLPGAALATGDWATAEAVLRTFADHQDDRDASDTYGRIPNRVTLTDVTYNTADGTPLFVRAADRYRRMTGDAAFARDLWPVVRRAAEGALRHVGRDGLFRHGDQETWMDASAGPGRDWSPRGDRAIEVQGFVVRQLDATADWAEALGHAADARRYRDAAERTRAATLRRFRLARQPGGFADHLNADDTANRQVRPNVLFALDDLGVDDTTAARATREIAERVAFPWGVASLDPADPAYHPYHEAPEFYPKDAAYHNGTIWTWLTGPLVRLMARTGASDLAAEQIGALADMALTRGAVGTMAENSDAQPRPGESLPRLTGTVSQAWTLAEVLRATTEDLAGITYDAPDRLVVEPHLPTAWQRGTTARVRFGGGHVTLAMRQGVNPAGPMLRAPEAWVEVAISGEGPLPMTGKVEVRALGGIKRIPVAALPATVRITNETNGGYRVVNALVDGDVTGIDAQIPRPYEGDAWDGFRWQTPRDLAGLRALAGPGWPLLTRAEAKARPGADAAVRLDLNDPAGDDRGESGTYTYPTHPAIRAGIFDARRLVLREDAAAWYVDLDLTALTQPGWNPHLGFQLTMAAIAFGDGGAAGALGREARLRVDGGISHVVYVGAGVRIEDRYGNVLAEYRPGEGDAADPLGSIETGRIAFRIPKTVLPSMPAGTPVTLAVGGQDDHGGAGIGDFRAVAAGAPSEWTGGGLPFTGAPWIYDTARGVLR